MKRRLASSLVLVFSIAAGLGLGQSDQKKPDPFLTGDPFTLEQLKQAAGAVFEKRLVKAIQTRGLTFYPDQRAIDDLQRAGATPKVISSVRQANAPPPPRPASQETNTVTARCQPQECEIFIEGSPKGSTNGGGLTIKEVPVGMVKVGFRKPGYAPQEIPVNVAKGLPMEVMATLEPTSETAQNFGRQLFRQIFNTLGGAQMMSQTAMMLAEGEAVVFDAKGERTEWSAAVRMRPGMAFFKMQGAGNEFTLLFNKGQRKASRSFSKIAIAGELETDLRLFIDYRINGLINRIAQDKFRLLSTMPPGAKTTGAVLRAESTSDRYQIQLADGYLPASMHFDSGAGLGTGLQVVYSDYVKYGTVEYPREIAIKLPDAPQHGIEFRFSNLTLNAPLKDKDFR